MTPLSDQIKVVAFDADDTLWMNEQYFRESEERFCEFLSEFLPPHDVEKELFKVESDNLSSLGYGTKGFIISMIETAIKISDGSIGACDIQKIIEIGKEQLQKPVIVLDGVKEVLEQLQGHYTLIVSTKGDLMEQERKVRKSGLEHYFHHVEIVSEKTVDEYARIIGHLDIEPQEFLMIGNSLKSDVIPVLEGGGHAWHIPYTITWEMERVEGKVDHPKFKSFDSIKEIIPHLLP